MQLNEIEMKNYTTHFRGRAFDNVTEYIFVSDKNLNLNEFNQILEEGRAYLCGCIEYAKKQLSYKSGKVVFQHICKVSMSAN